MKQVSETASKAEVRGHTINIDRPEAKGGTDTGALGGEVFLSGLGGCFMSTLLAAASAREITLSGIQVDIGAELAEKPARFSEITMTVSGTYPDRKEMEKLVVIAERGCIVSNTLRGAVELKVTLA